MSFSFPVLQRTQRKMPEMLLNTPYKYAGLGKGIGEGLAALGKGIGKGISGKKARELEEEKLEMEKQKLIAMQAQSEAAISKMESDTDIAEQNAFRAARETSARIKLFNAQTEEITAKNAERVAARQFWGIAQGDAMQDETARAEASIAQQNLATIKGRQQNYNPETGQQFNFDAVQPKASDVISFTSSGALDYYANTHKEGVLDLSNQSLSLAKRYEITSELSEKLKGIMPLVKLAHKQLIIDKNSVPEALALYGPDVELLSNAKALESVFNQTPITISVPVAGRTDDFARFLTALADKPGVEATRDPETNQIRSVTMPLDKVMGAIRNGELVKEFAKQIAEAEAPQVKALMEGYVKPKLLDARYTELAREVQKISGVELLTEEQMQEPASADKPPTDAPKPLQSDTTLSEKLKAQAENVGTDETEIINVGGQELEMKEPVSLMRTFGELLSRPGRAGDKLDEIMSNAPHTEPLVASALGTPVAVKDAKDIKTRGLNATQVEENYSYLKASHDETLNTAKELAEAGKSKEAKDAKFVARKIRDKMSMLEKIYKIKPASAAQKDTASKAKETPPKELLKVNLPDGKRVRDNKTGKIWVKRDGVWETE
jgi:hypothetical protein